ncbi:MAG: DUF4194 domain-containing protein [Gammaproteobacteria bacterium]|nr:DUF4194 domain-containing protein [Gammaproteobacteria bacterium]MCF6260380.1 DUF4194 domain-containing protein [Gammaproteobacteria bacterium]
MLTDVLSQRLEKENLGLDEFRELTIRLLNYGVLCRSESQTEQQLYDRYLRIADLVQDYLHIMNITVFHDRRFEYLRLYPPGSETPGMEEAEISAFAGSLRNRLSQSEVAMVLVLRLQYDKALREGQVDDKGYVTESMEALSIAMKNILARSLPEKLTERKQLFIHLRRLRLIEFHSEEDLVSGEAWLKIHPMIVSFVNDDAVQALSRATTSENKESEGIVTETE